MGKIIGGVVLIVVVVLGFYLWGGNPDSINEALATGEKQQCTYVASEGDRSVEASVAIDGEKFMSTAKQGDVMSYGLFDGSTQYTWTSKDKNGFKMDRACLEEMKKLSGDLTPGDALAIPNGVKALDLKDVFEFGKDVKCSAAEVTIVVPTDVVFTDQCRLMKQSMKLMEQMKAEQVKG